MKKLVSCQILPWFSLIAGALGFLLRMLISSFAVDEKGLYILSSPLYPALFAVAGLCLGVLFLASRSVAQPENANRFPASPVAAFGSLAAAVGILLTDAMELFIQQDFMTIACFVLGILAAAALVAASRYRLKGLRPPFALYAVFTVYLMLHPLSQYRIWSRDPQLLNFCFHLLASVFLMLTAYQRAALDAGMGNNKHYVFFSQAALVFSCISIQGDSWLFYLTMVIWAATNSGVPCAQEEESP